MFFITLSANALCLDVSDFDKKTCDTISAVQVYHCDILNTKNDVYLFQNIQKNDSLCINGRKSDNFYDGGLNNLFIVNSNHIKNIIDYIYVQSYLRNKSDIEFSIVLSEIYPNAP